MTQNAPISLITLDLDDTLWPCDPVIAAAEIECQTWLARRCPAVAEAFDIDRLRAHRRELMQRRLDIAHDITAVRIASLSAVLEELGYPSGLAAEAVTIFVNARQRVTPYADVAPVLRSLRRAYRLVSVTNGNAEVERTPLAGYFELSLTAALVGAAKPAPVMFLHALERTGVEPEQALHVGDDPLLDVEAARQIGMQAIWINRNGRTWPQELPAPEMTIGNLHELEEWLMQRTGQIAHAAHPASTGHRS